MFNSRILTFDEVLGTSHDGSTTISDQHIFNPEILSNILDWDFQCSSGCIQGNTEILLTSSRHILYIPRGGISNVIFGKSLLMSGRKLTCKFPYIY